MYYAFNFSEITFYVSVWQGIRANNLYLASYITVLFFLYWYKNSWIL